jgi:hypothetical protein
MKVKYVLITAIAVFFSFFFHEVAHWVTGELLGNDMAMRLNSAYPKSGNYIKNWHATVISATGPLFTILQGIVFYFIIDKTGNRQLYPFLLLAFIQRFLAMALTFINPNDEARISQSLGLGLFTLPLIVCVLLFIPLYKISNKYNYGFKFNGLTIAWAMLFISTLIFADQYFKVQLF